MSEFRSSGKPTGKFDLLDHHGNRVSSETYRGLFTMIYFGFTNCRVVCPRTLAKLTLVLDLLGSVAQEIQPLYISVDPERDSPEAMRSYLGSYPHFTGLTGSPTEIDMKVAPQYEKGKEVAASSGCLGCHKIGENGNAGPGPPLTQIGSRLGRQAIARTLINPTPPMPPFTALQKRNPEKFDELVNFLSSLK